MASAEVAIIGGSGFYELLTGAVDEQVETPYGPTSGPISLGRIGDRDVAFLPRHGPGHVLPPHRIPYRANLWALRRLGVTRVVAPCAVGSLRADVHPGDFVICDQFVDRTWGRPDTYFDGPEVSHVTVADPYCPELRAAATEALRRHGSPVHPAGTVVVVQGPRFSTRAESAWYRAAGWDVINMTQYPEVALARELGMCFCGVALVTDYDTGVEGEEGIEPVSMDQIFAVLALMVGTVREVMRTVTELIPVERSCGCASSSVPDFPG
ncbi:MAG TPA: S-methyl-5'-thioadenosine phosphorylase [Acidimicrobiales bacterium]|nr:S-methyl-5'-thioadenosine phosphorylase [Acidimicrobiales bacterium]